MIDLIKSAKTIQKALDKQTLENTTSGWMEENVTQAIFVYSSSRLKSSRQKIHAMNTVMANLNQTHHRPTS